MSAEWSATRVFSVSCVFATRVYRDRRNQRTALLTL